MIADILQNGALPLVGVLIGFILGRRERNQRQPVAYRCDCGHSLSRHRPGDGKKVRTDCMYGNCSCQQYIGTRPIEDEFLAPRQLDQ